MLQSKIAVHKRAMVFIKFMTGIYDLFLVRLSLDRYILRFDGLDRLLGAGDTESGAAILLVFFLRTLHTIHAAVDRFGFAISYCDEAIPSHTFLYKVVYYRLGALLGEFEIVSIAAAGVGMRT